MLHIGQARETGRESHPWSRVCQTDIEARSLSSASAHRLLQQHPTSCKLTSEHAPVSSWHSRYASSCVPLAALQPAWRGHIAGKICALLPTGIHMTVCQPIGAVHCALVRSPAVCSRQTSGTAAPRGTRHYMRHQLPPRPAVGPTAGPESAHQVLSCKGRAIERQTQWDGARREGRHQSLASTHYAAAASPGFVGSIAFLLCKSTVLQQRSAKQAAAAISSACTLEVHKANWGQQWGRRRCRAAPSLRLVGRRGGAAGEWRSSHSCTRAGVQVRGGGPRYLVPCGLPARAAKPCPATAAPGAGDAAPWLAAPARSSSARTSQAAPRPAAAPGAGLLGITKDQILEVSAARPGRRLRGQCVCAAGPCRRGALAMRASLGRS